MFPVSWKELCFESVFVPDTRNHTPYRICVNTFFLRFPEIFPDSEKHGKTLVTAFHRERVDIPDGVNYDSGWPFGVETDWRVWFELVQ